MVLSPNDVEVASSEKKTNSRLECTNHTLFQTKQRLKKEEYPLAPLRPI